MKTWSLQLLSSCLYPPTLLLFLKSSWREGFWLGVLLLVLPEPFLVTLAKSQFRALKEGFEIGLQPLSAHGVCRDGHCSFFSSVFFFAVFKVSLCVLFDAWLSWTLICQAPHLSIWDSIPLSIEECVITSTNKVNIAQCSFHGHEEWCHKEFYWKSVFDWLLCMRVREN